MGLARHRTLVLFGLVLCQPSCQGGDSSEPSPPPFFTLLSDGPCDGPAALTDTLMQPHGQAPNAGSGYIDSYGPGDRPARTVFWVVGFSRYAGTVGQLTFVLLRVPNPPPVGRYRLEALADSTVWLEEYTPTYRYDGVPFDMSEADFVVEPFTGSVDIEESDSSGVVGTLSTEGRYRYDGVLRCMRANSRFSTRY
jgi:hypothetical protein